MPATIVDAWWYPWMNMFEYAGYVGVYCYNSILNCISRRLPGYAFIFFFFRVQDMNVQMLVVLCQKINNMYFLVQEEST